MSTVAIAARRHASSPLRAAGAADLAAVNAVVASALTAWRLPTRVQRLALPLFHYDAVDLDFMTLIVAERDDGTVAAVGAWEPGAADGQARTLVLHGLFVAADAQHAGIGTRLLGAACAAANRLGLSRIVVRAWREAEDFFLERGFRDLPGSSAVRVHPRLLCRTSA